MEYCQPASKTNTTALQIVAEVAQLDCWQEDIDAARQNLQGLRDNNKHEFNQAANL